MTLLTPKAVALRLGVSPRTVYSWIAEGRLATVKLSQRVTRVPEEAVEALIADAMVPALISLAEGDGAVLGAEAGAEYGTTTTLPRPHASGDPQSESERLLASLRAHRDRITAVVARHRGSNVRVFGSVVRGDATEVSDIDLLVDAQPGMTLFDLSGISMDLTELLGRRVDVVVARSLRSEIRERTLLEACPL